LMQCSKSVIFVCGSRDVEAATPLVLNARYLAWSGSWRICHW
jgi:hypothetical protein